MACELCGKKIGFTEGTTLTATKGNRSTTITVCKQCNEKLQKLKNGDLDAYNFIHGQINKNTEFSVKNFIAMWEKRPKEFEEAERQEAERQRLIQEAKHKEQLKRDFEARERIKAVIVTTGDIKQDYEIIGPVYFQVSNKGIFSSRLSELKSKYYSGLKSMRVNGIMSEFRADWGFLYGEWSVGQNDFEAAFYIAVQELKQRALIVGGNAIVGMRQDIDLDTNGFSYFYLQMYGTAVRLK